MLSQILRSFLEMMKKIIILMVVTCQIQSVCSVPSQFASLVMCGLKRRNNTNFTNQQLHPSVSVPSERHIPISVHGCVAVWPLCVL